MKYVNVERNMKILMNRLVELRKANKLTQQMLSEELGYTRSSIASWEMGTRVPNAIQLSEISEYYNVTSDYLLGLVCNRNDIYHIEV